jgi:urea transport system permease protein
VVNNNRMRGELDDAIAALKLFSPDRAIRLEAAKALQGTATDDSKLALIQKAEQAEQDQKVRDMLVQVRASIQLNSHDKAIRLIAVSTLGESSNSNVKQMLSSRLAPDGEADPEVRAAVKKALLNIDRNLAAYEYAGLVFTGISLGSILLLAALGLAITYGLMGIINMAHGEMIMIGAYTTFVVQNLFRNYLPEQFQWYLLVAIPAAFLVTALVGMLLERSVLRFLYNRPLESLLATWGISLMLMQLARSLFGAQNVAVENPAWMSGGVEVAANLVLPYSRIAIILFAATVLLLIWILLAKTRLGLFVRAVTQNRLMASCVGVHTGKVDTLALAGVALSQIGNVGPDLGQQYIVDSFMVVVLGGVGQLAGAAYAAMGLGIFSKFLEGSVGAVLAKIIVLVFIIIFIQKRPQGIFALKGRAVDA